MIKKNSKVRLTEEAAREHKKKITMTFSVLNRKDSVVTCLSHGREYVFYLRDLKEVKSFRKEDKMSTDEAFDHMLSQHLWGDVCGLDVNSAARVKWDYIKGKMSLKRKIELLEKAGYLLKMEWKFPQTTRYE